MNRLILNKLKQKDSVLWFFIIQLKKLIDELPTPQVIVWGTLIFLVIPFVLIFLFDFFGLIFSFSIVFVALETAFKEVD